jgi:hypothetical protein
LDGKLTIRRSLSADHDAVWDLHNAALHLSKENGYRETGHRKVRPLDLIDFEKELDE